MICFKINKLINVMHHIQKLNNENDMIIIMYEEKVFHPYLRNSINKMGIERMLFNIIEAICDKLIGLPRWC